MSVAVLLLLLLLLICVVLLALAGPLIIGAVHLKRGNKKAAKTIISIYAIIIVSVLVLAFFNKRSIPGRIVRQIKGETFAVQKVNDLAEDIRTEPSLAGLQPWAIDTLRRIHTGEVQTNEQVWIDVESAVNVPSREVPQFIRRQWKNSIHSEEISQVYAVLATTSPRTPMTVTNAALNLSPTNADAESILIVCGGGNVLLGMFRCYYGVMVGPTNYVFRPTIWPNGDHVTGTQVKPGIYVFVNCEP
jgi:hypothetical protein